MSDQTKITFRFPATFRLKAEMKAFEKALTSKGQERPVRELSDDQSLAYVDHYAQNMFNGWLLARERELEAGEDGR